MPYIITTADKHRAAIQEQQQRNLERRDLDVSDSALSSWGADSMIRFHELALEALELGAEHGIDGPALHAPMLQDAATGRFLDAVLVDTQYGLSWKLGPAEQTRYRRVWVPHGPKSRIQRTLGIRTVERVVPASPVVLASCSGIGSPLHFILQPRREDDLPPAEVTP